jgi:hypothetical protein
VKLSSIIAALAFLPGCAFATYIYNDHYPSTLTTVKVEIEWFDSEVELNEMCWRIGLDSRNHYTGCSIKVKDIGYIYVVKPKDFNDHFRLEVLGHELYHMLGAYH